MVSKDPIKYIIEALMANPEGLTLLSLASISGLHRHTCRKYINELTKEGIVFQRDVGAAKLCYLKQEIKNSAEGSRLIERLKKKRKGAARLKFLVSVVILTLLVSQTAIIAYANSTMNATNTSNINTSPTTSTSNVSDLSAFFNDTVGSNDTQNTTVEPPTIQNLTETVGSVDSTNESSETQNNSENSTFNTTFLTENVTDFNETEANDTFVNDTNTSQDVNFTANDTDNATQTNVSNETEDQNQTIDIEDMLNGTSIDPIKPVFDVDMTYPQRITRGELISITAVVSSNAYAKNVLVKWLLPVGFEIVSGNAIETCGDMNASSCISEIGVITNMSEIGVNSIKVVVDYEE
ncbi:MAG: winged helix-turn-helix transcriptional regulator [Candidatus Aenigmarchaeota archaeon]|nr:winged helix-turn-helix transcriptional regulator [Candidatus Aenigmarchaeota archaeon]